MIAEFDVLSAAEVELMLKAPILVCILVAGADDNIDEAEMREAIHLAKKKSTQSQPGLIEFYSIVAQDFEDKLKVVIQSFPIEATQRNPLITEELSQLNVVLPRLATSFSIPFYKSIREIARKVAESSGGIFGISSIGSEEATWVDLPMVKSPSTF
ncbi:MAG: hypothetical protein AABY93_15460 [Bacteroidota bacterium]